MPTRVSSVLRSRATTRTSTRAPLLPVLLSGALLLACGGSEPRGPGEADPAGIPASDGNKVRDGGVLRDSGAMRGLDGGGRSAPDGAVPSREAVDAGRPSDATPDGGRTAAPIAGNAATAGAGDGFYQLEKLDRGLVAVQTEAGVYLGWRLLGSEYALGARLSFEVLRDGSPIAQVSDSTNYLDASGQLSAKYTVQPVVDGQPEVRSAAALQVPQGGYLRVPLMAPEPGVTPGAPTCEQASERYTYTPNDASAADLDGDGQYELVLKWDPSNAKDNSQSGCTGPVYLDAYELDGTRLWRIDLGPNIRAGAHYTQFIAYDLDGDGKAELSLKTAPGTRDGTGTQLAGGPAATDDDAADYRSKSNASGRTGYVLSGPEYLTVFEGATGKELATAVFSPERGTASAWGDDYGNRVDRFLAAAAYLDDSGHASLVMARGYYTRSTLTAYNYRAGQLSELWRFDSNQTPRSANGKPFTGQGAHSLSVANVDDDPQQEIIYGAMVIDHDGRGLCSTGLGHGDALHVSDLVPSRPGLEVFMPHEDTTQPAYDMHDARTCELLVTGPVTGKDTGRGVAADVVAERPGAEIWAAGTGLLDAKGAPAGATPQSANFLVYWDADPLRELLDAAQVQKYGGGVLVRCMECSANNGTKSTPTLVADLFGDHREEIVWRETNGAALRIYTTTVLSRARMFTLMHDAQYRAAIAWQNVGYNQPAQLGFSLTEGVPAAAAKP
jgi:rhamnogalacturonan endolyase